MSKEKKKEILKEIMRKEFKEFVIKNARAPKMCEFKDFSFSYATYVMYFGGIHKIMKTEKLIPYCDTDKATPAPPSKHYVPVKTERIRKMLKKKPKLSSEDLEKEFGEITRSIRVTFYRVHKEMFGTNGSLRKEESI